MVNQLRQTRTALRQQIHADFKRKLLRPETVTAFAALHMATDDGVPISPAPHHWLWLRLMCNNDIAKLLIIGTPESAKTTWVLAYIACVVGFWPDWPGIFATASDDTAEVRSLALRNIIESPEWALTFPHAQRAAGLSWRQDRFSLATDGKPRPGRIHATVSAYGTGGSITGSRARWIVADDILTYENSRTVKRREVVDTWVQNSLLSRVQSRVGRIIVIGNAWHHDDTHARLAARGGWVICRIPLLSESRDVYATITYPDDYRGERLGEPVGAEVE